MNIIQVTLRSGAKKSLLLCDREADLHLCAVQVSLLSSAQNDISCVTI